MKDDKPDNDADVRKQESGLDPGPFKGHAVGLFLGEFTVDVRVDPLFRIDYVEVGYVEQMVVEDIRIGRKVVLTKQG